MSRIIDYSMSWQTITTELCREFGLSKDQVKHMSVHSDGSDPEHVTVTWEGHGLLPSEKWEEILNKARGKE